MKYYVDSEAKYLGGWDRDPPDGATEVPYPPSDARQIWDGSSWAPLSPNFPSLTARQLRLGLIRHAVPLADVETAINAIENTQDRALAKVEWEFATVFEREHPLLREVALALGLSGAEVDAMWKAALQL